MKIVLISLATLKITCFAIILFNSQPSNVTVLLGQSTFFPCNYSGSLVRPLWIINDNTYSSNALPDYNHLYNSSGLIVKHVNTTMNLWTYSCLLYYFDSVTGSFLSSQSDIGVLFVITDLSSTNKTCLNSSFFNISDMKITTAQTQNLIRRTSVIYG